MKNPLNDNLTAHKQYHNELFPPTGDPISRFTRRTNMNNPVIIRNLPTDKKVTIKVTFINGLFEAVYEWNDGELNSKLDYEVPMFGVGVSMAEAVGCLVLDYAGRNMITLETPKPPDG